MEKSVALFCYKNILKKFEKVFKNLLTSEKRCVIIVSQSKGKAQKRKNEVIKMKKTNKMATIGQLNRMTGNYAHIERRVFEDENGFMFVKINGDFTSLNWLETHGRAVDVWF